MSVGRIEKVGDKKDYVRYATLGGGGLGGVPVGNVRDLALENGVDALTLTWKDPDDVIFNGEITAEWAGTKVVRKENDVPKSVDDGIMIADSKVKNQYSVEGLQDTDIAADTKYNYAFFPYTSKNIYTMSDMNRISAKSLQGYSPVLSNNTWADISRASEKGIAKELWKVGDTKDGYIIVGFGHDDLYSGGGKAGITFACNDSTKTIKNTWKNTSYTNAYLWTESDAYTALNNFWTNNFPDEELKSLIKPVRKYHKSSTNQGTGNKAPNGYVTSIGSNLFLFAYAEISQGGQDSNLFVNEGSLYEGFPLDFSEQWWTRTWTYGYSTSGRKVFCVTENGEVSSMEQRNSLALRYGFCI